MDDAKKDLLRKAGFSREVHRISEGLCPTCGEPIRQEDFRDKLSRRKFGISGLCQKCQDKVWGGQ